MKTATQKGFKKLPEIRKIMREIKMAEYFEQKEKQLPFPELIEGEFCK